MESPARLRTVLLNAIGTSGTYHGEQELFEELAIHKPALLRLLDVGGKSASERNQLQSGMAIVNGKQMQVNDDFKRQAIFLSDELDVSEHHIAGLLQSVMSANPNIARADSIEATVLEFHRRRRQLLDSLRYVLEAAVATEAADAPDVMRRIEVYARQHLLAPRPAAGTEAALALTVFKQLEGLDPALARALTAKQNAVSDTRAATAQAPGALGHDVLEARCNSLKYERRALAGVLYLIARLGYFGFQEVRRSVDWLADNPAHAMVYYILTAALNAFDSTAPGGSADLPSGRLTQDNNALDYMRKKFDSPAVWKEPGLKATLLLKWTLFLTEARHRDASLERRDGFKTDELETQIWNGVQGDGFAFMARLVGQLHRHAHDAAAPAEPDQQREVPTPEFRPAFLQALEILVRSLVRHASSELRKIKQRQEDVVLASARTDRGRMFRTMDPEKSAPPPRNDIATLFAFVGALYTALPAERALQFWGAGPLNDVRDPRRSTMSYLEQTERNGPRLPSFLQWSVWSTQARDVDTTTALYSMLAGIAKGQQCSELAYNFVARGAGEVVPGSSMLGSSSGKGMGASPTLSWASIFGLLESWAGSGAAPKPPQPVPAMTGSQFGMSAKSWQNQQVHHPQQAPGHHQVVLGPKDVLLAQAFLRFLSTVITHSVEVRKAISGHAQFRAIPTLVSLLPLGVPLELKGAVFSTLAAFCEPGAGPSGVEICKAVWGLMERLEVINVRAGVVGSNVLPVRGVEVELEEVEAVHKLYPATIPFLQLLATLVHTPKRVPLRERIVDHEPTNTIPESLGQPYRLPGVGPFLAFVVDNVFLKIPSRDYAHASDRWQMNDLSLCFVERCLASYDLEALLVAAESAQLGPESLAPFLVHPGYEVMKRLLTSSPLQTSLLSYLVEGVDGFDKGFAEEEPYFHSTVVRVLRIVQRVLEIQDVFLDVLIPLLSEFDSSPLVGVAQPRSYFSTLDQALSFGPQYVPALAAYSAYSSYGELMLLSIKILTTLSRSTAFLNLTALVEGSSDSDRILYGYRRALGAETTQDVAEAESVAEQTTGAGAADADEAADYSQAVRLAALELLTQNTHGGRSYPNVAHFLLFGKSDAQAIEDPHALGARSACIHIILQLLNTGVPRLKGNASRRDINEEYDVDPLFVTSPVLAERCCRVIHQLCSHPRTSELTTRYLRTREDFFTRQLGAIPFKVPQTHEDPFIEVVYADGSRVITTVPNLTSFLRYRSLILDLVALDLHILTSKGHFKGVTEILQLLFEVDDGVQGDDGDWEDGMLRPFREVGQSHLRIIELVQSLNFDWSDSLAVEPMTLDFLGHLDLRSCVRVDAAGCEIVDKTALLSLILAAQRSIHSHGRVMTQAHEEQVMIETAYILESCAIENHRRETQHAIAMGHEAWRKLLDMTLTKCFGRLPQEHRENVLFDHLHVLPTIIRSDNVPESTAIILAEATLSAITKLREDRRYQELLQVADGNPDAGSLPAERLYTLLRNILEATVDKNRMELVRGNLYAVLIGYLHLIASFDGDLDGTEQQQNGSSLAASRSGLSSAFGESRSSSSLALTKPARLSTSTSSLQRGSLSLMKDMMERLVVVISRDAINGAEVWKTVSFMLLDALIQLSKLDKQQSVLTTMIRHGILSSFVRELEQDDLRLQSVLKPDPDDLDPLYVYEAKMSMFIRIAQSRPGAERLLEVRLLSALAKCDYLDARPEADHSFADQDAFLPSAIQRYHQLFMPALQVIGSVLVTLGSKHTSAGNQALAFLSSHRDTVVILLKNGTDFMSLSVLEEVHLLVNVCAAVLPLVPKSELSSSVSGFGAIHAAVLGLAARTLGNSIWIQRITAQLDSEILDTQTFAPGTSGTRFEAAVRKREYMLRNALTTYLGTASDFTEPELTLVLAPIATPSHQDERSHRVLATVPTVGDTIEALDDLCGHLTDMLKQIEDLSAELASRDHLRVENIEEIVAVPDAALLEDLDIRQKKALVSHEMERIRADTTNRAHGYLATAEMLLLLLWRHVQHYLSEGALPPGNTRGSHSLSASVTASFAQSTRTLAALDPPVFQAEVAKSLGPVLQRLAALEIDPDALGEAWRSNAAYIEIMGRRLRDAVGLLDQADEGLQGME